MAISVTPNLTEISDCDQTTDWSGATIATDAVQQIEGTACLATQVKATTSAVIVYTYASGVDMTGKHIYMWIVVNGTPDTQANGGIRIYVEDSSGNNGTWYVGGKDTPGGWQCYVIDPASTPTSGSGTIVVSSILKVGLQFKTLSSAVGTVKNCFWDVARYGTGLTITSGTTDQITFEKIFEQDDNSANKYGVVTKGAGGVYIIQGLLTFGGTAAENIDFVDKGQVVLFPKNTFVSNTFYGIKVLAGTGTVNFTLGEAIGGAGVSGCLLKAPGTKKFYIDASDTDIDKMQLYGSSFVNAGTITLLPNATNREVLNCAFEACGELIANTCVMTNCNFISSPARALKITAGHNVTNCNFINCQTAVHHNVGGPVGTPLHIDYDKLMFTGGTYHIENSAVSPDYYIDIDRLNGSNPLEAKINNSNGGTTTLLAISVVLTLTGLIAGSDVRIMNAGTTTVLDETDNSGTTFNYSYNYGQYPNIDIIVLHLDYEYFRLESYTPGASNASMPIPLRKDRWYSNP